MMKKIISLFFVILASSSTLDYNAPSSTKKECIDLLSVRVFVTLPFPYHSYKENYEEGVVCTYTFKDGGYLLLMEGALMQIEIDTYRPGKIVKKNKNIIISGQHRGKLWKKYVSDNTRIYYGNVDKRYKAKYDRLLRTIKIIRYSRNKE